MRPIKLELNYIGPYEKEVINLDKINDSLFLISGKTGSGKSMIFDAITYALFATSSTTSRGNESLRSQFAPSTEPSIIHFTFLFRGKTYRVERRLRYFRGNNKTETPPESSLYNEFDELIAEGLTKVTTFIETLLQLDATQFRQVGLLPQGEFKKFLVASSSDKEEILKALFSTERFNLLYQRLKKEHDEDKKQLDFKYNEIMNTFKNELEDESELSFNENLSLLNKKISTQDSNLSEYVEKVKNEKELQQKLLKEIQSEEANNDLLERLDREQNKLEETLKDAPAIKEDERQLELIEKVNTVKIPYLEAKKYETRVESTSHELNKVKEETNIKKNDLDDTKNKLEVLIKKDEEIAELQKRLNHLHKFDTPDYRTVEKDFTNSEEQAKSLEKQIKDIEDYLNLLKEKINDISIDDYEVREIEQDLYKYKNTLEDFKRELKFANQYEKHQSQLLELKNEIEFLSSKKEQLDREIKSQNRKLEEIKGFDAVIINDMIRHLEVGKPCILCQQTVEQIPGTVSFDEALYEEQRTLEENLRALDTKYTVMCEYDIEETRASKDILEDINYYTELISQLNDDFDEMSVLLKEKSELEESLNKENETLLQLKNKAEILNHELNLFSVRYETFKTETNFNHYEELLSEISKIEDTVSEYASEKESLEKMINNETIEMTKLEGNEKLLENQLSSERESLSENKAKLDEFFETHRDITENIFETTLEVDADKLKARVEAYYQNVRDIESVIKNIKQNVTTFEKVNLDEKRQREMELNESLEFNSRKIGQLEQHLKALKQKKDTLKKEIDNYEKEEAEFTKLAQFVNILNGRGVEGVPTLSRFVLVYYLEVILNQANIRLQKMTNGRYELRRVESYRSDRSLHIDVFDHFNNARRSVATLSGGESFQAALALALSLSEIIQHEAGSIEMDILLIDEGFGTLDEDTLKIAIDTLIDLQKTGKMIGIISHVEELKNMIGNILFVETEEERSKTRLVTPLSY